MKVEPEDIIELISSVEKHRFHFIGDDGRPTREVSANMKRNGLGEVRISCGQGQNLRVMSHQRCRPLIRF